MITYFEAEVKGLSIKIGDLKDRFHKSNLWIRDIWNKSGVPPVTVNLSEMFKQEVKLIEGSAGAAAGWEIYKWIMS